jgi:hypothetical protein
MGALEDLGDFFKKIGKVFGAISQVGQGVKDIFEGVVREFTGVPQGIWYGALDTSVFIQYIWEFFITNFMCGMKLMQNAFSCAIWYILEIIGQIMYLVPRILFFLLDKISGAMKKGLKVGTMIESTIWNGLEFIDRLTITYLKFHIIHYSKSIREMCYNCKRLKPTVFVDKALEIVDDLGDPILPLMIGGLQQMIGGLGRIANALMI